MLGYVLKRWTTAEGLPHNSLQALLQTRDGYLWIGTARGGLVRFDGLTFTTFNILSTPALGSDSVAALARDAGGDQYQILTVPGPGRPLEVRAWNLVGASVGLARAVPITGPDYQLGGFIGGVTDVDGDGQLDAVVATDRGIGALVGAFTVDSGRFVGSFAPFGSSFLGGARLSLGDIDGNGVMELIVSPGTGGRPIVDVLTLSQPPAHLFRFTSVEIP